MDLRGGSVVKNPAAMQEIQETGFDPWVRKIRWRRAWQPIPVFLPGEPYGQRSLVGYSPQHPKEWDTTEAAEQQQGEYILGLNGGSQAPASTPESRGKRSL